MTVRPLIHHAEAALNLHAHAQAADTNAVGGAAAPALAEAVALLPAPSTASGADAALATVRREMAAAKEAAAAEMALMRRQLASAQAAASEAEKAGPGLYRAPTLVLGQGCVQCIAVQIRAMHCCGRPSCQQTDKNKKNN